MGENLDFCDEEPLASMWPPAIEDKSNRQFNIDKPSLTEENLTKELLSKEEKIKYDFDKLKELSDHSDIGSHQLTSLVEQYTFQQANAARLLNEELDLLYKQRQEIEQRKEEILQEHHYLIKKNQISVSEEGYEIQSAPTLERAKNTTLLYNNDIGTTVDVTGLYGTESYWKERATKLEILLEESLKRESAVLQKSQENATQLGNLLDESLKRESVLLQKLQENAKMEEQNLPVKELSSILERADNFLHFILQNAPIVLAHQDKDLRYRFIYNHFPSLGEEGIIGKTDDEILLEAEGVKELQDFKREVLENGKAAKREITFETPLFGKKTFLTYVEPVFNKKREVIGINSVWFEVTDQVAKREKLAKYREEMAIQRAKETELLKTMHNTERSGKCKNQIVTPI